MTSILDYQTFYLVGIKGVAMTALANCLVDAGKTVRGSDVAEQFVTQTQLDNLGCTIDTSFDPSLISDSDCVVYTAAHQGPANPQVQAAKAAGIPTLSHAEALGSLFNQKQGIAVCGVGGKSTTSAMITWILYHHATQPDQQPSYVIGVGGIPGLVKTGQWNPASPYFVAEADEYVTDPQAVHRGEPITPRFSYLQPSVTVCTNLRFDHPDVYRDFEHTKQTYTQFFNQIKSAGWLVVNGDDQPLTELAKAWQTKNTGKVATFGKQPSNDLILLNYQSSAGKTTSQLQAGNETATLELIIPGEFNVMNALAAIAVTTQLGVSLTEACHHLTSFASTMRRAEFVGEKAGVKYYDDYAHHPNEVAQIIKAFTEWYPNRRVVIAFQSHTFSRTKQLFDEFVTALATAKEVVMIDIFPSAREAFDATITSDLLCQAVEQHHPQVKATNLHTISNLAEFCRHELKPGDVLVTVGAGDIYQVHSQVKG
jgi:UDP-N-acetylmuramate--alanine ligase